MKRFLVFASVLLLFLSVSTASAWLFGPPTIECDKFSIEYPDGFQMTDGWSGLDEHIDKVYLGTGIPRNGETHRYFEMWEVLSFDNLTDDMDVVEDYTEGDLKVMKGHVYEAGEYKNFTYATFDKGGRHYFVKISWDNDIEQLDLAGDVKLIKTVRDSTKPK